jgi:hypothetical protein
MVWMTIRLELARTPEFPQGSASRAYRLTVPVGSDGLIDATECRRTPAMATVRRFWANEPDRAGYLIPTRRGWAFSYRRGEEDDEHLYHFGDHQLVEGNYLSITEPDGTTLPFRVVDVTPVETIDQPESLPQTRS